MSTQQEKYIQDTVSLFITVGGKRKPFETTFFYDDLRSEVSEDYLFSSFLEDYHYEVKSLFLDARIDYGAWSTTDALKFFNAMIMIIGGASESAVEELKRKGRSLFQ